MVRQRRSRTERSMKTTVLIMSIIALLAGAAILLVYATSGSGMLVACRLTECGRLTGETALLSSGEVLELSFEKSELQMSVGECTYAGLNVSPPNYVGDIKWTSSSKAVATVDEDGMITARASGTAQIIVRSGDAWTSIRVTVTGDIIAEARAAIAQLASGADPEAAVRSAAELSARLARCEGAKEKKYAALMAAITAYASGSGDSEALDDAIKHSGEDGESCRMAATVCRCVGERGGEVGAILSFTGDVTMARYNEETGGNRFPAVYAASGSVTYPFDGVRAILGCDDLTVVNFEGTLTERTEHRDKTFYFRGEPSYAAILPMASIEVANLGNNHSGDYYEAGYSDTKAHLSAADVLSFGENEPLTVAAGDGEAVLIAFLWASDSAPSAEKQADIIRQIENAVTPDRAVIVNAHWGGELHTTPQQWQIDLAHRMIDAGADMVVGHHPHVLQGAELYNGRYIFYSLGNFVFGGNASVSNPQTVILRAQLGRVSGEMTVRGVSVVPCYTTSSGGRRNDYRAKVCFGEEAEVVMDILRARSNALDGGFVPLHSGV